MEVLSEMIVFRSDHGKSLAISDDWSSTGEVSLTTNTDITMTTHSTHTKSHSHNNNTNGALGNPEMDLF